MEKGSASSDALPKEKAAGSAAIAAAAAGAATVAACAACVGVGNRAFIAQGHGREQRQGEELVADIFRELLGRGNVAEAVAGNQNFHVCQHLQDDGDADGHLEAVIA